MAELWAEYGAWAYVLAFAWSFFEGETFVLVAAAAGAATGVVDPLALLMSVWAGSFCGDQTWFGLGRKFGPRLLERLPRLKPHADRANTLLARYGAAFILSFRFLYGIRNVASIACGIAGFGWRQFMLLNFAAAGLWASSFVAAGWFLGNLLGPERLLHGIAIGALAMAAFVIFRTLWRRRNKRGNPTVTRNTGRG